MSEPSDPLGSPSVVPPRPAARVSLGDRLAPFVEGRTLSAPRAFGVLAMVLAIGVGTVLLWPRPAAPAPELSLPRASTTIAAVAAPSTTLAPVELVVDAAGEVRNPGVYRVSPSARVTDVINAAGGLTDRADRARVNLAAPVADGQRVFVPAVGQEVPPIAVGGAVPGATTDVTTPGGGTVIPSPVNVNTAGLDELETLPGVGPATAQAIIDHRTQNGPFASVDELLDVRGIGDAKLADLRDRVVV